jgi:hypothetical protein
VANNNERIITIAIMAGLFGGLVGGPIASLVDYYAPPYERFKLFIIPEFIGFVCLGLMVYFGKSKKKISKTYDGIEKLCFAYNTLISDGASD